MIATPFFYQSAWYVKIDGQRVYLVPGTYEEKEKWKRGHRMYKGKGKSRKATRHFPLRDEVTKELGKLMISEHPQEVGSEMRVADLVERYLTNCEIRQISAKALKNYRCILEVLAKERGHLRLDSVTPSIVETWASKHKEWESQSYLRKVIKVVCQVFNFATENKFIAMSPIRGIEKPQDEHREIYIEEADEQTILAETQLAFRTFFEVCLLTGRRPGEVASLRPSDVVEHNGRLAWKLPGKNYRKTGRKEYIVVADRVQHLTGRGVVTKRGLPSCVLVRRVRQRTPHRTMRREDKAMAVYEIEQYEIHTQRYRVEANSEAEAIKILFDGEADPVDNGLDFIEVCDELGLPADKHRQLAEILRSLGVAVGEHVIRSIRSINVIE